MNTGKLNRRISYTSTGTFVDDGFGGKTQSVAGTSNVTVLLDENRVSFALETADDIEKVKQAIERAGYDV